MFMMLMNLVVRIYNMADFSHVILKNVMTLHMLFAEVKASL
jgi:hypothetical protein